MVLCMKSRTWNTGPKARQSTPCHLSACYRHVAVDVRTYEERGEVVVQQEVAQCNACMRSEMGECKKTSLLSASCRGVCVSCTTRKATNANSILRLMANLMLMVHNVENKTKKDTKNADKKQLIKISMLLASPW